LEGGSKQVKLRLFDEKRKVIELGDRLEFISTESGEVIRRKVVGLPRYRSFADLIEELPPELLGSPNREGVTQGARRFYTPQREEVAGVLGIRLAPL